MDKRTWLASTPKNLSPFSTTTKFPRHPGPIQNNTVARSGATLKKCSNSCLTNKPDEPLRIFWIARFEVFSSDPDGTRPGGRIAVAHSNAGGDRKSVV